MTLWEFPLAYGDGTALDQTVLAEGDDEAAAAASALKAVIDRPNLVLSGPGHLVPADVEARWREVCENSGFPDIVPKAGRLARYARGLRGLTDQE